MAASLNEIYKSIGELTTLARSLSEKIDDNERRNVEAARRADQSRANAHHRLDEIVQRTVHLETDMTTVKGKVEDMEKVTVEVTTLRTKAEGAGTFGRWLIRIGIGVVTLAGWIIGVYTWLTGRPPP